MWRSPRLRGCHRHTGAAGMHLWWRHPRQRPHRARLGEALLENLSLIRNDGDQLGTDRQHLAHFEWFEAELSRCALRLGSADRGGGAAAAALERARPLPQTVAQSRATVGLVRRRRRGRAPPAPTRRRALATRPRPGPRCDDEAASRDLATARPRGLASATLRSSAWPRPGRLVCC